MRRVVSDALDRAKFVNFPHSLCTQRFVFCERRRTCRDCPIETTQVPQFSRALTVSTREYVNTDGAMTMLYHLCVGGVNSVICVDRMQCQRVPILKCTPLVNVRRTLCNTQLLFCRPIRPAKAKATPPPTSNPLREGTACSVEP